MTIHPRPPFHDESIANCQCHLGGTIEKHAMKLRGKSRLLKLFARAKVDLVLHGHVHESREYLRDGVRFLNAGGSVLHDQSPDLHVNIVRMTDAGCFIEIHKLTASETVILPRAKATSLLLPPDMVSRHEAA